MDLEALQKPARLKGDTPTTSRSATTPSSFCLTSAVQSRKRAGPGSHQDHHQPHIYAKVLLETLLESVELRMAIGSTSDIIRIGGEPLGG